MLFLYLDKGQQAVGISLISYLFLLFTAYIVELLFFDLSEYTDQEESRVRNKSRKNIYLFSSMVWTKISSREILENTLYFIIKILQTFRVCALVRSEWKK